MITRCQFRQASNLARRSQTSSFKHPSLPRRRTGRNEIISPGLCDDILQRLRKTLPPPNTCDLIDVNPGKGLWSQKLHSVLQPRRHVLVESDIESFANDLNPLLTAPKSRYRHTKFIEDIFDPRKGLLTEHKAPQNPMQLNKSLLMTINLTGAYTVAAGFQGPQTTRFFNTLYLSLWRFRGNLFRYGHIRVIAWIPDEEKETYLPRSVGARRKQTVLVEGATKVAEIAGASRPPRGRFSQYDRWINLENEDFARVQAKTKAADVNTPKLRQAQRPSPQLLSLSPDLEFLRNTVFRSDSKRIYEYMRLDDWLKKNDTDWYNQAQEGSRAVDTDKDHPNKETREVWRRLKNHSKTEHATRMKAFDLVLQQRALEHRWKDAISKGTSSFEEYQEEANHLARKIQGHSKTNRLFADKAIDDYRAYDHDPAVLSWNHREMEPLIVHPTEFTKSKSLALLDIVPKPDLPIKLDTYDKVVCFGHVMYVASSHFGKSVYEVCCLLIPAGVDEFLKGVPSVFDVTKGGWFDLEKLRIRSLPVELLVDIAIAYDNWPFRPSTDALLTINPDIHSGVAAD